MSKYKGSVKNNGPVFKRIFRYLMLLLYKDKTGHNERDETKVTVQVINLCTQYKKDHFRDSVTYISLEFEFLSFCSMLSQ